ncbi:hypothetical protein RDWZM_010030 [Blomia tropicalis]|uniref:Uncharacterized protein n=1 Tax=Blomia tropicalis TaxID=40697 RepID=A0A9Q0RIN6_BLOTA|nr:hypothetical protein RDWZM_010030 [Blomia tropicalis]
MTQSKSEQVLMNMEIRNNLTMMTPYQLYPCTSYDGYYISLKVWNVRSFRYVTIDCEKESCCKMVIPVLELNTIDIPERFNLEKSCLLPKNFFCREMPDKQLTIYLIGTYAETIKWTSLKDKIINVGNFRTSIPLKRGNRYSSIDRQCSILVDMFNDPTIQNIFSTEHLQSGDVSDKTGQFFSFEELYLHSTFSYNQCHDALISFTDEWTPPNNFHFNTSASSDEQVEGETQTEIQRPQVKLPCFQSIWKHSMAYDKTNVCNVHDDEMDYTMAIADEPGTSFDQQTSPTDNQRSNHTNFQQINIHNEIGRLDISNSIINVFNIYNISNI